MTVLTLLVGSRVRLSDYCAQSLLLPSLLMEGVLGISPWGSLLSTWAPRQVARKKSQPLYFQRTPGPCTSPWGFLWGEWVTSTAQEWLSCCVHPQAHKALKEKGDHAAVVTALLSELCSYRQIFTRRSHCALHDYCPSELCPCVPCTNVATQGPHLTRVLPQTWKRTLPDLHKTTVYEQNGNHEAMLGRELSRMNFSWQVTDSLL